MEEDTSKKPEFTHDNIEQVLKERERLDKIIKDRFRKKMTIVFSDVCGFTSFMDRMGERFLAVDVLTEFDGGHADHRVHVVRGGADHGVDRLLAIEHPTVVEKLDRPLVRRALLPAVVVTEELDQWLTTRGPPVVKGAVIAFVVGVAYCHDFNVGVAHESL